MILDSIWISEGCYGYLLSLLRVVGSRENNSGGGKTGKRCLDIPVGGTHIRSLITTAHYMVRTKYY